jgi:hypothetical protein
VSAYYPDTTPDYTVVCPVGNKCFNVPVVLSLIDPHVYTVYYDYPQATYNVNSRQIVQDVCDVIGITCILYPVLTSLTASSMPHGLWAGARLVGMSGAAPGYGTLLSRGA